MMIIFFFNDTATTEIYTLSLHDALPISAPLRLLRPAPAGGQAAPLQYRCIGRRRGRGRAYRRPDPRPLAQGPDRKSTRLNSSHANISYAVFCLKKKKKIYCVIVLPYSIA